MMTKVRKTFGWLSGATLLAATFGCSGQTAETKRQLETLNERLLILQNDRDRLAERVDALEARISRPEVAVAEESPAAAAGRPSLKVVRLEPTPGVTPGELGAEVLGEQSQPASPSPTMNTGSDEPKVVLYGEGTSSGVRASAEGVTSP